MAIFFSKLFEETSTFLTQAFITSCKTTITCKSAKLSLLYINNSEISSDYFFSPSGLQVGVANNENLKQVNAKKKKKIKKYDVILVVYIYIYIYIFFFVPSMKMM